MMAWRGIRVMKTIREDTPTAAPAVVTGFHLPTISAPTMAPGASNGDRGRLAAVLTCSPDVG